MRDMVKRNRHNPRQGSQNGWAKITERQAATIRIAYAKGETLKETWKHVPEAIPKNRNWAKGSRNSNSKLTLTQIREIRRRYRNGEGSMAKLAREYSVHSTTIYDAIRGKKWII